MSARSTVTTPKLADLGADLLHVSSGRIGWSLTLPFAACGAYWVLAAGGWWMPAVIALMVLSFSSYGSTSHDLVHGALGLNRRVNDWLLFLIEAMCLRSGHAYKLAHLHHHARFPHHDDVEAKAARMSFVRALLEGIVFQFRIYVWALKHPHRQRAWIIAEGLVVTLLICTALAALPWTILPAVYAALMIAGSWIIPLVTSYVTHRPDAEDELQQTRVFRGWFFRLIAFDHLYHLEHHLYPAVPHHNWHELATRLDPWFSSAGVEPVRLRRPGGLHESPPCCGGQHDTAEVNFRAMPGHGDRTLKASIIGESPSFCLQSVCPLDGRRMAGVSPCSLLQSKFQNQNSPCTTRVPESPFAHGDRTAVEAVRSGKSLHGTCLVKRNRYRSIGPPRKRNTFRSTTFDVTPGRTRGFQEYHQEYGQGYRQEYGQVCVSTLVLLNSWPPVWHRHS